MEERRNMKTTTYNYNICKKIFVVYEQGSTWASTGTMKTSLSAFRELLSQRGILIASELVTEETTRGESYLPSLIYRFQDSQSRCIDKYAISFPA